MAITRNDTDQVTDGKGNVLSSVPVVRDVTLETNHASLRAKAAAAVDANAAAIALPDPTPGNTTYLGLASPTNAQVAAQVKALTQQNNALVAQVLALTKQNTALIRLALGLLDSVAGT